jgi:hypothetical protein
LASNAGLLQVMTEGVVLIYGSCCYGM